jgi:hypothetical protein
MSWKGKEVETWQCWTCNQINPYGIKKCVFCAIKANEGKSAGSKEKGSKGKGVNPVFKGKGKYNPYPYEQTGGENYDTENPEKEKLKKMRQALKIAEGIEGWEDKIEELKAEVKEQLILSNQEQGIERAEQAQILLTELKSKKAKLDKYKEDMDFHHKEGEKNARNHQTMDEDIGNLYEELEALGWNPPDTESEEEEEPDIDSLEYWEQPVKTQKKTGSKETTSQSRARHAKNRAALQYDISDEEQNPEEKRKERRKAANNAATARKVKTEKKTDRQQAGGSMAAAVDADGDNQMT